MCIERSVTGELTMSAVDAFEPVNQAEIDLGAMAHNAREIRRLVGGERFIVAALKSNAHGFGLVEVATTVARGRGRRGRGRQSRRRDPPPRRGRYQADHALRRSGVRWRAPAAIVDELDLMVTVLDLASATVLSSHCKRPVQCMVKVDVGLQRLGLYPEDVVPFVRSLVALPDLQFRGVYTHMHAITGPQADAYLDWQFGRFTNVHCRARASRHPRTGDACRLQQRAPDDVGDEPQRDRSRQALLRPSSGGPGPTPTGRFRPGFRSLKEPACPGEACGTRQVSPTCRPSRFGRECAWAFFRSAAPTAWNHSSTGHVLVRGRRAPILMRPSLEHTRIDLTDIPEARVGDEVVIIGRQGDGEITPAQVTTRLSMDPGELAVGLRGSIERRYIRPT